MQKLKTEYFLKYESAQLFQDALTPAQEKHKKQLESAIEKIETEIEAINSNKIYENAFEWRFEFPQVLDDEGNYIGFDIVVGNPPYIQLQKMGEMTTALQKMSFQTFARTGDIYCLFYEKAHQLLKQGGICNFITSNKWMRAGYGEATRKFFIENTNPLIIIDFAGVKVFETATVDVNILLYVKEKNTFNTLACIVKDKELKELSLYVRQHAQYTQFKNADSWVILSDIEQRIKAKIEAIGTPLKDWDINIYRGILTGYNEAFIIDKVKKEEILANCKTEEERQRTAEIIRPILRGRDIKRYGYEWNDKYVIIARLESDIPNKYPAICKHLEQFKGKGKLGDNSTTKVFKRPWWAWMQEPVSYWEDFSKQKIVYSDISERLNFQIIENEIYFNNTIYFITSQTEDLTYLLKFLSSNLIDWYYKSLSVQLGEKAIRMFTIYVLNIPIPKKGNRDNIYESYQLTEEEEEFIESLYYN